MTEGVHPALAVGRVAVITGAASGIGRAAAIRLGAMGMALVLADRDAEPLAETARLAGGTVRTVTMDVSRREDFEELRAAAAELGEVSFLFNNAGIGGGGDLRGDADAFERVIAVNLMGVVHGVQAFLPAMLASDRPALIVNTGSKQGITQPPGNTAYNIAKSGVKVLTEGLAHTVREASGRRVAAHLLIPGFTYTGLTAARLPERPPAAWTSEQVVDLMLDGIARGDFYILCPDNETSRAEDEKRILWAAGDIVENRPALSRWHPDWKERFAAYMAEGR